MKLQIAAAALLAALFQSGPALAEDGHSGLLDRWYDALVVVEREEISALLSPDATIELKDIGVTQTSAEFVSSLDEWADAIKGGSIRHRIDNDGQYTVSATVCYSFATSAMMTKEDFVFAGKQIISSVQQTIATNCDGY
jgi:hypothetical protein